MKKPIIRGGVAVPPVLQTSGLSTRFPSVWAFLTDSTWDDGTVRETGSILLCSDSGYLKAWLNDRAGGRTAWFACDTLDGTLELVEQKLLSGMIEWRSSEGKRRRSP